MKKLKSIMNRTDFPILGHNKNKIPLIYLDNAATSHKPQVVIDSLSNFYSYYNANIHRGVHSFGEQATQMYEDARLTVANFIGADDPSEVIFTRGTTESINNIAYTWGLTHIGSGDIIVVSELEHHAHLLPWQWLAQKTGAQIIYIPVSPDGQLDMLAYDRIISLSGARIKLVAVSAVSNALGTHNDIQTIINKAHIIGARVSIDAAQLVPYQPISVHELKCDFLAFSGHKMLGPTGIGVLYIKRELHESVPPFCYGGGMVYQADFQSSTWLGSPHKFEAGTPPIADAIGLAAAINYLTQTINFPELANYLAQLSTQAIKGLKNISGVTILGPVEQLKQQGHLVSFTLKGFHPHDIAAYLNSYGICVRAGHHCAQPLAKRLGFDSSVRISFYGYTTSDEITYFLKILSKLAKNETIEI